MEAILEFLKGNWFALLMGVLALAEIVTRLTPTEKDNTILGWIRAIIGIVFPNKKSVGGAFDDRTK